VTKLEDWYARCRDSHEVKLAQQHLDAMAPSVRIALEANYDSPIELLFALTCRADDLASIPVRVAHVDVLPLKRD
jgi:hypothetical protein